MTIESLAFHTTDEQGLLLDSAQRFVRDYRSRPASAAQNMPFCRDQWRAFAELGWLALSIDEEFGGIGGTTGDLAVLMRGLGPAMLREPLISSSVLATTLIERATSKEVAGDLLERAATGELIFAVALEEFIDHPPHMVAATESGQGFRLSGASLVCWNAPGADALLVQARLESDGSPALFLVQAAAAGLSLDPYRVIDGSMAADLVFDGVEVDPGALLGLGPGVTSALDEAVDKAILAHCAKIVGILRAVLDQTTEYLKTREQFGGPLSRFQALQHRAAEMFVQFQDATAALDFAVRAFGTGLVAQRQMHVSAAKVVIAEAARYIGGQGIQLHGAIGVTEEYQIGHYYRNILLFEQMYGNTAFHMLRYQKIKYRQN